MRSIEDALRELLALPRSEQVTAAMALLDTLPDLHDEAWNSRFGPGSLFDAWSRTSIASGVHRRLAEHIRPVVERDGFVVIEVGAGNGRTWDALWTGRERGTLVVVDPVEEALAQITVPDGVACERIVGRIEDVALPASDLIVCSMTLHHLAGRDAEERARHGLVGPGKREVLERFRTSIRPRGGRLLLVEADVDCEVHLPPGDPVLRDNLFDSYVRRCAHSILLDLERDVDEGLRRAWRGLLQHWFLGQIRMADVPLAERDVYELTVPQWRDVLEAAGLDVQSEPFDDHRLFHLHTAR